MELFVMLAVGWGFGVFAFSNILLPLFWAYPKARKLCLRGVRPAKFVVAPIVWSAFLLLSLSFIAAMFSEDSLSGYLLGLGAGFLQTMRLVISPSEDMEADFLQTFGSQ